MRASLLLRQADRLSRATVRYESARAVARPGLLPPFGDGWARAVLPHYFTAAEPADFHAALFARLASFHATRDSKAAVVAPREGAKSTVVTLGYVLHCAVTGLE